MDDYGRPVRFFQTQCAGRNADDVFHFLQDLLKGCLADGAFGTGPVSGAVKQIEGLVAAGEFLGFLGDPVLQLGVGPRQVLDHEVEGFTKLSELVGLPSWQRTHR
jgi:hypothetical protein